MIEKEDMILWLKIDRWIKRVKKSKKYREQRRERHKKRDVRERGITKKLKNREKLLNHNISRLTFWLDEQKYKSFFFQNLFLKFLWFY